MVDFFQERQFLTITNYVFTAAFTLEMCIKVTVDFLG